MSYPKNLPTKEKQFKSRTRIKELAEVYTNEREINNMLDLVRDDSYNIYKRFFEPACGNGNFLKIILDRKMYTVKQSYLSLKDFEYQTLIALSSIYGVDICNDNVSDSKHRLYESIQDHYSLSRNTDIPSKEFLRSVRYILNSNILHGNTLEDHDKLIFTEYVPNSEKYYFTKKRYWYRELFKDKPVVNRNGTREVHYLKLGGVQACKI